MVKNWGLDMLRSGTGVIDVGGDPGFVATAFLRRGIPVTIVDPTWAMSGKVDQRTASELAEFGGSALSIFREYFDDGFCKRNFLHVDSCSAIISMYGDEATAPSIQVAAGLGKPCAIMPCNECIRFFPPQNQTYEGYVYMCIQWGNQLGGRFEFVQLNGAPFSRALVVQGPLPEWAKSYVGAVGYEAPKPHALNVPVDILREMGVLNQVIWKMDLARRTNALAPADESWGGY